MKKKFAIIACAVLVCCVFGLSLYEPQNCPLCHTEPSDAPYLVDLHTGEIGEIRIGKGEMSDDPTTFIFYFVKVAGCDGYCDTASRCCQITLKSEQDTMNPFLYCRSCRAKLRELRHERYAILHIEAAETSIFPIVAGIYEIGTYSVDIVEQGSDFRIIIKDKFLSSRANRAMRLMHRNAALIPS